MSRPTASAELGPSGRRARSRSATESQRDMNTDATEPTRGIEAVRDHAARCPSGTRRRPPRYCSAENSSVTFTGTPAHDGLLDRRQALLGARDLDEQVAPAGPRAQLLGGSDGLLGVVREQRARPRATPSRRRRRVRSWIGRNRSAARRRSSIASSKNRSSPVSPAAAFVADRVVVVARLRSPCRRSKGSTSAPSPSTGRCNAGSTPCRASCA